MVPPENLIAFVAAAVVLVVIPGPSVLFTIGRALALGRTGGLLSVAGNALGMLPLVGAVALGIGAVVASSVVLFTALKVIGAAYLIFLGIQAIRHRRQAAAPVAVARRSPWRLLGEAFVVGVTNPKTIAFFVAVLPQFVSLRAGGVALQILTLGTVFVVLALVCDSVWALGASAARAWFARSPRRLSAVAGAGGGMMIGLGGVLLLTGRRSAA